jgi:hypothetical protein
MKFTHSLTVCALVMGATNAIAADPLPDARVTLPYAEFRSLLDTAQTSPPRQPPVPFVVLSSRFVLTPADSVLQGSVVFDVESFGDSPQLVPLLGDAVTIRKITPETATVVRKDGFYQLLLAAPGRQAVTLELGWPGQREDGATSYQCAVAPAVVAELELGSLPDGTDVSLPGAVREGNRFHLGARDEIALRLSRREDKPAGEVVPMPPVVTSATSEMRVVNDGTFFNATSWTIRHNTAFAWRLQLGPDVQVVSCLVDGRPAAPVLTADHTIELRLPEKDTETKVVLSYTGKTSAFAPVRGDFAVALPSTDLLVERSDWKLTLPAAFAPMAVEGNAELLPGATPNEVLLRKELVRGEAPATRIFYQKPETTNKP